MIMIGIYVYCFLMNLIKIFTVFSNVSTSFLKLLSYITDRDKVLPIHCYAADTGSSFQAV